MMFQDLRQYVTACQNINELVEIKGAHWDYEIGVLTEAAAEKRGPALLFDQIKDYQKGWRVLSNAFSSFRRTALVFGLSTSFSGVELLNAWREKSKKVLPIAPIEITSGPVLENMVAGDSVNLWQFPTPIWHAIDGGRYLGTGCAVITMDPDNGKINLGTYRCMIQGENRISVKMNKGKHGRIAMEKYHSKGQSCPIAISIGHEPSIFAAASAPLPFEVDEYSYAGWLRGQPVEVVKSDYSGLIIPAYAEIVLEGEIAPLKDSNLPKEGPFGEWPGYYSDTSVGEVPLMSVRRIFYRNDPIILGVPPMKPSIPSIFAFPFGAAQLWDQLEKAGIPDIKGVWGFVSGAQAGMFTVIALKQRYAGHSKQAGLAAATCRAGAYGGKFIVVVDEDVDITNAEDVIWVMGTRCNIREDIELIKGIWTSPADPAIHPKMRSTQNYTSDRIIIDACRPYQWMENFPIVNAFDQKRKEEALLKWGLSFGS
jgi:UbiD family decarboxylase